MALADKKVPYEELVPYLDWAYREKQAEVADNARFKKSWDKLLKLLLKEHGWTLEDLNNEIDRRMFKRRSGMKGLEE